MVRCIDCQFFTRDKVGDGTGIGTCSKYEEHKKKHGKKAAIPKGRCLYPNATRECNKFVKVYLQGVSVNDKLNLNQTKKDKQ